MDKVISNIIERVALKHGLTPKEVEQVHISPYKMIRQKIVELELKGKCYDEVKHLKTNFNMPVLFKMYLNEFKLNKINTERNDEDKED